MGMNSCWESNIPDKCFKFGCRLPAAAAIMRLCLFGVALGAAPFAAAVHSPPAATKATTPKPKAAGGAGLIAIAQRELESRHFDAASRYAKEAGAKAPALEDYAEYIREQAAYNLKDFNELSKAAAHVFNVAPASPLSGPAAALAVKADLEQDSPKPALDLIRRFYPRISQPDADFLLAECFRGTGDLAQATEYFQRVYYLYPLTDDAVHASAALAELKIRLGEAYPPPMGGSVMARVNKLADFKKFDEARLELEAALPLLAGAQRDVARVRLGEMQLAARDATGAFHYLKDLRVDDPESDAERLAYTIRAARRADKTTNLRPFLDQLASQHPESTWRLDALIFAAGQAHIDNDASSFLPLYQACAAGFPNDPRAAGCHWRLAFYSYWQNKPDAFDLLREQLQRYPAANDANSALYFLGRYAELHDDRPAAVAYFDELAQRYPNTYYAIGARERLRQPVLAAAPPDPKTVEFLRSVAWPPQPAPPSFSPAKTTQRRIERAQLLALADLEDWAENELKFGARNDGEQPHVYALSLARLAASRDAPDQAIRYIKAFAPGYLGLPVDSAPPEFWHLAFPLPFRGPLDRYSRAQGLDPFLVASLIRQESEFNVKVISHANAYGLMQVLPSTGKELARRLKIKGFSSRQLLTADLNLELGTYYFKNLLDSYAGEMEYALAAYNAGKTHADEWRQRGTFREPAEFIESIPFDETRGYVQIVLRGEETYRRLYPSLPPAPAATPVKAKPAKAKPAKSAPRQ
jgi:soluble lytic murein transglycosylase